MNRTFLPLPLSLALTLPLAAVEHVTAIGDSLTKEYQVTFPGLPGIVDGIDPTQPFARNWSEILNERRNAHFDLGVFKNSLFFNRWADLRLLGHEYNWAVPGATARALRNLVTGQDLAEITSDPDFSTFITFAPEWAQTAARLTTQVQTTSAAAVIWCGGNDLRYGNSDPSCQVGGSPITYETIYDGDGTGLGNPQPLMDSIKASLQAVAQHLRTARPGLPIVVCAVPHVGCTPAVQADAPTDAVRTGRVTTALRALNDSLREWTETTLGGVWVDTFSLTEDLIGADSVVYGGVTFINGSDVRTATDPPAAHHRYLFSHDGFHPGTTMHAIVSQRVQAALRAKAPAVFGTSPVLTDREVIVDVLGIPAATGFNEFMAASGAPADRRGPHDDADADGLVNLGEFSLDGNTAFPGGPVVLPAGGYDPSDTTVTLTWKPRYESNIYAAINCQSSPDFATWTDVPAENIATAADGTRTARVPAAGRSNLYLRLKFTPSS
jgi:phospholipase/lecithinase/hemolysin